jgi:carbamoyl-phosphate synthase large subunit
MPKRTDIQSIMIIGAGPIVIGQACEFDYSGAQACKALREEGYRVILVNSNPATIMTDPEMADATYIEPITPEVVAQHHREGAPLTRSSPPWAGQTGLNTSLALADMGVLEKFGVELIGAKREAIEMAEDRKLFREAMDRIGIENPKAEIVTAPKGATASATSARACASRSRRSSTSACPPSSAPPSPWAARGRRRLQPRRIRAPLPHRHGRLPVGQILVDESLLGWKEFEMEVVRDRADNAIIVCSIENVDPMGVHTGDSITVGPRADAHRQGIPGDAQRLHRRPARDRGGDRRLQRPVGHQPRRRPHGRDRDEPARVALLGARLQGHGFPIAKVAAKLAVGYTLDELDNDITKVTPASFEPTIDYVVTKIPRFAFEKFPGAQNNLTTAMKSVGEAMAIGRTIHESLQKALASMETGLTGFDEVAIPGAPEKSAVVAALSKATPTACAPSPRPCATASRTTRSTPPPKYDPWFLARIREIVDTESRIRATASRHRTRPARAQDDGLHRRPPRQAHGPRRGPGPPRPATARRHRRLQAHRHLRRRVRGPDPLHVLDLRAPAMGEVEDEARPLDAKKVVILGGGPNRIGQGIEFDYCCCHACFALSKAGYETIMVNCNPETVSTDYDTSDRLYFEPVTFEHVMEILRVEQSNGTLHGVIVQFGGQTPLKLAMALKEAGIPILGTTPDAIDLAEDRERFQGLVNKLGLKQPHNGIASSPEQAFAIARRSASPS